jgi:hypothetical protein
MIYLITFDINSFIQLSKDPGETDFQLISFKDGIRTSNVQQSFQKFTTELYDETLSSYFGDTLSSFLDHNILILNFNSFLIKWIKPIEELVLLLKSILGKKDRFVIIEFNGKIITNFQPQEQLAIDHFIKKK